MQLMRLTGVLTILGLVGALTVGPAMTVRQAAAETSAPKKRPMKQVGTASWYGRANNGKKTASGERFDAKKLTAAHPTLPLGTKAKVTNLETGKSTQVTINDRGPYVKGRKIDLSHAAAEKIGITKDGVAQVRIEATLAPRPKPDADRKGATH